MTEERLFAVVAGMLGVSCVVTLYARQNGTIENNDFLRTWFDRFSKWLGYGALFWLVVFAAQIYTVAFLTIFWVGVAVIAVTIWWAERRDRS